MWHKADWGWMRRWVYLPEIKRLRLNWMIGVAWQEGGLKDDPKYLEKVTGIPKAEISDLWEEFTEITEHRDGRWMLPEQWAAYDDKLKFSVRGSKAGKASAEARKQTKDLPQQDVDKGSTPSQQGGNKSSTSGQHPAYIPPDSPPIVNDGSLQTKDLPQQDVDTKSTEFNQSRVDEIRVEKKEGQKTAPPFSPEPPQSEGELPRTVWQALEDLFPGEAANHGKIKQIAEIAEKYHATVADVGRWKRWMKERHPGVPTTYYKFRDFFGEMMEEGVGAAAWLNGSIGGRFCLFAVGYKPDSPVPPRDRDLIITTGKWIDNQVKLVDKNEWYDRGIEPENFKDFWKERHPDLKTQPRPESIQKAWDDFITWLGISTD